VQENTKNNQ